MWSWCAWSGLVAVVVECLGAGEPVEGWVEDGGGGGVVVLAGGQGWCGLWRGGFKKKRLGISRKNGQEWANFALVLSPTAQLQQAA